MRTDREHCFRIGTAGWQLPATVPRGPGRHALERYAERFNAVEINSTFYRMHRPATFERWAQLVPDDLRFAVKMAKTVTHERRLERVGLAQRFLEDIRGLGSKLGVVLLQLPPSLRWSATAESFLRHLRESYDGALVLEARNPSWYGPEVDAVLKATRVGGVGADPPLLTDRLAIHGDRSAVYYRLHGSPRMYWSAYDEGTLARVAATVRQHGRTPVWVIFDNTAAGAAAPNALRLMELLDRGADQALQGRRT